jgi:lysophospholipase L1-like esterase
VRWFERVAVQRRSVGLVVLALVVVTVVVVVLVRRGGPTNAVYVALGDSYTAGPLIPRQVGDDGCQRSDHNYPSLVAERTDVELVDVSCTGASTSSLAGSFDTGSSTVPAQLEALDGRAETATLITVGIGANDGQVASLALAACSQAGADDPGGATCSTADAAAPDPLAARVDRMEEVLTDALAEIRRRAPAADVLAIGYPQVVPEDDTCRDLLPIAAGDLDWARDINQRLDDAVRAAAERAGVEFIDVWAASEGHDVCADEPWFNGAVSKPGAALAFHPFLAYQEAVADLVIAADL